MKKRFWLLILVCCLLLCGCHKVRDAENAIATIGTITPNSGTELRNIQALLDDLSEHQLNQVENLQVFRDSMAEYERMCSLIDVCKKSIQAIGTVSLESGDAIQTARDAYEALKADALTAYVEDLYPTLESAESRLATLKKLLYDAKSSVSSIGIVSLASQSRISTARAAVNKATGNGLASYLTEEIAELEKCEAAYADLDAENLYKTSLEALRSLDYARCKENMLKLKSTHSQHPKAELIDAQICQIAVEMLGDALSNKSYLQADKLLQALDQNFVGILKNVPDFEALRQKLRTQLEAQRPETGEILHNDIGSGWGELTITANAKQDAVVKLTGFYDDVPLVGYTLFYIRKGETATISVADGSYLIYYGTGNTWYGEEDCFGEGVEGLKPLGTLNLVSFATEYSGNQVTYTVITATIPD